MTSDLLERQPGLLPTLGGHVGGSGMQVVSTASSSSFGATSPLASSKRNACSGLVRPVSATHLRKPAALKLQETWQSSAPPWLPSPLGGREHSLGGAGGSHGCGPPSSPHSHLGLGSTLHRQFQALKAERELKVNELQDRCESILWKNEELEVQLRRKEEERSEATQRASMLEAEYKDLSARVQAKAGECSGLAVELEERGRRLDAKTSAHSEAEHRAMRYHSELQVVEKQAQARDRELMQAVKQADAKSEDAEARLWAKIGEYGGLAVELEEWGRRLDAETSAHSKAEHRAMQYYSELQAVENQARARDRAFMQAVKQADAKSEEHFQRFCHMTSQHESAVRQGEEQIRLLRAKTDAHQEAERIGREKHTELQDTADRLRLKEGERKSAASLAHERNMQLEALQAQLRSQQEANSATEGQLRLRSDELEILKAKLWAVEQEHATAKAQAGTYFTEMQASGQRLQTRTSEFEAMERFVMMRDKDAQERLVWQAVQLGKAEAKLGDTQHQAWTYRVEQEAALYKVESRAYRDELQDASASNNYMENELQLVKGVMETEGPLPGLNDEAEWELFCARQVPKLPQQQQRQLVDIKESPLHQELAATPSTTCTYSSPKSELRRTLCFDSEAIASPKAAESAETIAVGLPRPPAAKASAATMGLLAPASPVGGLGTAPTSNALPADWESATDPGSGRTYYHNKTTNETRWERPIAPPVPSPLPDSTPQSSPPSAIGGPVPGSSSASSGGVQLWKYTPPRGKPLLTRETPEVEGVKTVNRVNAGDILRVVEERPGAGGVLFLKLEDNKGWLSDQRPGVGVMCVRHDASQSHHPAPSPPPGSPPPASPPDALGGSVSGASSARSGGVKLWKYVPANGKPMPTRATPEIEGSRTKNRVNAGDILRVEEERPGVGGMLFLKLEDNKGWLFDQRPGIGVLCVRHDGPQSGVALPPGWESAVDPSSGRPYYVNRAANETKWECPVEPPAAGGVSLPSPQAATAPAATAGLPAPASPVGGLGTAPPSNALPAGWESATDPGSGRTYYHNKTGFLETRWERPIGPPAPSPLPDSTPQSSPPSAIGGPVPGSSSASPGGVQLWKYVPANGKPMPTRATPEIEGVRTLTRVNAGDILRVEEERPGVGGVLFLKLEDNKGWLFDQKPGIGVLCMRHDGPPAPSLPPAVAPASSALPPPPSGAHTREDAAKLVQPADDYSDDFEAD